MGVVAGGARPLFSSLWHETQTFMASAVANCVARLSEELTGARAQTLCDELFADAAAAAGEGGESLSQLRFSLDVLGAVACGLLAACAAGLTMGVVSLDEVDLRVKARCGSDSEKRCTLHSS